MLARTRAERALERIEDMLTEKQDAEGRAFIECLRGRADNEIIERDDGFVSGSAGPGIFFTSYDEWPECEKAAMKYVRGRVLDVGCGAGRHLLHLRDGGFEVVGIDASPLAVEVCKARGLRDVHVMLVTQLSSKLGTFDTIMMMGNNFGLFGGFRRARWLLRRFHGFSSANARIIAASRDPHATEAPENLAYHERNRLKGRMPGQIRMRVRYKTYATPWYDYLLVSAQEMRGILQGTGWRLAKVLEGKAGMYAAIIEKTPARPSPPPRSTGVLE